MRPFMATAIARPRVSGRVGPMKISAGVAVRSSARERVHRHLGDRLQRRPVGATLAGDAHAADRRVDEAGEGGGVPG